MVILIQSLGNTLEIIKEILGSFENFPQIIPSFTNFTGDILFGTILNLIVYVILPVFVFIFFIRRYIQKQIQRQMIPISTPQPISFEQETDRKILEEIVPKDDEIVIALQIERLASEAAIKSLEEAYQNGDISDETFDRLKNMYYTRIRKINTQMSRTIGLAEYKRLEKEFESERKAFLEQIGFISPSSTFVSEPPFDTEPVYPSIPAPEVLYEPHEVKTSDETKLPPIEPIESSSTTIITPVVSPEEKSISSSKKVDELESLKKEMLNELNKIKKYLKTEGILT